MKKLDAFLEKLSNDEGLDREYLECDKCNLVEDGKMGMDVFTCFNTHGFLGEATDMQFKCVDEEKYIFECPNCGNQIKGVKFD